MLRPTQQEYYEATKTSRAILGFLAFARGPPPQYEVRGEPRSSNFSPALTVVLAIGSAEPFWVWPSRRLQGRFREIPCCWSPCARRFNAMLNARGIQSHVGRSAPAWWTTEGQRIQPYHQPSPRTTRRHLGSLGALY